MLRVCYCAHLARKVLLRAWHSTAPSLLSAAGAFKIPTPVASLAVMITVMDGTAIFHQMLVSQFIRFLIY